MNEVLKKSADLMLSSDYKERFIAEYLQINNRYEGLKRMLENWDRNFKFHPCPREVYTFQLKAMEEYRDTLVIRAEIEGITLC